MAPATAAIATPTGEARDAIAPMLARPTPQASLV
jgi:hypothetical protein